MQIISIKIHISFGTLKPERILLCCEFFYIFHIEFFAPFFFVFKRRRFGGKFFILSNRREFFIFFHPLLVDDKKCYHALC